MGGEGAAAAEAGAGRERAEQSDEEPAYARDGVA